MREEEFGEGGYRKNQDDISETSTINIVEDMYENINSFD
jgi:hypothetical protein